MTHYVGKIPEQFIDNNIKWLMIVPQVEENKIVGYFMYLHETLHQPAKWDNWYQNLEIAFEAGEAYGLKKEDWKVINSN